MLYHKHTARWTKVKTLFEGYFVPIEDNLFRKAILAHVNLNELDDLVKGDKIFKLHSVGAAFFGSTLLLAPDLIIQSGPIAAFAYQQWSLFILAVAYITYNAHSLNKDAKTLLSNAYFGMCSAEAALYLFEILRTLFRTPFNVLVVDLSSLAVFSFLALGYWRSGNTSICHN